MFFYSLLPILRIPETGEVVVDGFAGVRWGREKVCWGRGYDMGVGKEAVYLKDCKFINAHPK